MAFTDFGRCGELTDHARGLVADLLVAIIDQDGDAAATSLEVSAGSADVDIAGLKRDVTALIASTTTCGSTRSSREEMVIEMMSLVGKRGLTMSSEFALLLTTLATIQALGTSVDPQFHFVESVQPFARRLVEEQMQPDDDHQDLIATLRARCGRCRTSRQREPARSSASATAT